MIDESLLHGMQAAILRQTFNGGDRAADGRRQGETGKHAPTLDQHSAGAALAMVASLLASGQVWVFP